jgi:hypothetical protein
MMASMLQLLVACTPATVAPNETDDTEPGGHESAETGAETAETGDTEPPPVVDTSALDYDCDALPTELEDNELDRPRGYHDVLVDDEGYLIGSDGSSLVRVSYDDQVEAYVPGMAYVEGFDRLRDGDLAIIENQRLLRVTPEGAETTLTAGLVGGYGVTVGPDGMVYVGAAQSVFRVDPDTGDRAEVFRVAGIETLRDVTFSLDCATMYVATTGAGNIWAVPVDANFDQAGEAAYLAQGVGQGTWHDGIGIDACGNVYVPDYSRSGLYRVAPDGTVTTIYAGRPKLYGHGLKWGNGVGGWRRDALYLPQPYDGDSVREVVIGVPQGEWTCAQ